MSRKRQARMMCPGCDQAGLEDRAPCTARIGLTSRSGTRRTASVWPAAQWPSMGLRRVGGGLPEESRRDRARAGRGSVWSRSGPFPPGANGKVVEIGARAEDCQV